MSGQRVPSQGGRPGQGRHCEQGRKVAVTTGRWGNLGLRAGAQGRWWRRKKGRSLAQPLGHRVPSLPCRLQLIPSPRPERKSLARPQEASKAGRWLARWSGKSPPLLPSPPLFCPGGGAPRASAHWRQCYYGDHRYLAAKLCCLSTCHLLALWGQACVVAPHLRKRTWWGLSQVDRGSRGHAETLLESSRESEVEPSHTRLWLFSKLGIIVLIYGIIKITL